MNSAFRQDINGMRALAVIGVIAFHFKLGPLRAGGFAGVDVFFVISGFLMTQIITSRLDRGSFSLGAFLQARVRRIVPAFVVMVIGVLAVGFAVLSPLVFEGLTERAAWTLPFLSNILFAKQGTYFVSPEQNWFLHTWSLAVEAQFYLLFPLLLVLLRRMRMPRSVEATAIAFLALLSFALAIWSLSAGGDALRWSFYMLWSRAWEFLVGSLCAYGAARIVAGAVPRRALHYGGLTAVILAMLIFHNTTPWPSFATLLPVVGAGAMLVAGHDRPRWADAAPTRRLGLWSYSVYLWHWPVVGVLCFYDYWTLPYRLLGIAGSLLLGIASHALVERRLTEYLWRAPRRVWGLGFSAFALTLVFAAAASQANGLDRIRFAFHPEVVARLQEFRAIRKARWTYVCGHTRRVSKFVEECRFGSPDSTQVLVVGDSFAAQLTPRYDVALEGARTGVAFLTEAGCVPVSKTKFIRPDSICDKWTEELYPYLLRSKVKRVVFIAQWPYYVQGHLCLLTLPNCGNDLEPRAYAAALDNAYGRLATLWKALREQGKEVVVFDTLPYPDAAGDPTNLAARIALGDPMISQTMSASDFMRQHSAETRRLKAATDFAGVRLVNLVPALCPGGSCPVVRGGKPIYGDSAHLRATSVKEPRLAVVDRYILPESASRGPSKRPDELLDAGAVAARGDVRGASSQSGAVASEMVSPK